MKYTHFLTSFSHGFIVFAFFLKFINADEATEVRKALQYAVAQYDSFPPLDSDISVVDRDEVMPIHVLTTKQVLSIDNIEPGTSQFTARIQSGTYWRTDGCNQTKTHEYACNTILSDKKGNHFFKPDNIKEPVDTDMNIRGENMHRNIFDRMNRSDIITNGEYLETIGRYKHQFDMKFYPWEIHGLEISYSSIYTSNIVTIETSQIFQDLWSQIQVPGGWEYVGSLCNTSSHETPGRFYRSKVTCTYYVTRFSVSWFVTSFLLFLCIVFASFAGSVGLISHIVAEARDDRDAARRGLFMGARMIGTFTIGLLLTYVIQMEVSPYEKPLDFWPNIPASTSIYCLGLICLFSQSFASMLGSLFLKRALGHDGFVGHPTLVYRMEECPKEGESHDIMDPLVKTVDNNYNRNGVSLASPTSNNHHCSLESSITHTTSSRRRCNTKMYAVLSVEEAERLNIIMKRIFITKAVLYFLLQLVIAAILVNAFVGYNNAKKNVLNEMAKISTKE